MENGIKGFDEFINEAKKESWIAKLDMKKGALKKEMNKKKLTKSDLSKKEASLKKKDKDKKKPGLQLNKKDAKTAKRVTLAKNLMKASGAIKESREQALNEVKKDLVKLHGTVEKLIAAENKKKGKKSEEKEGK